MLVYLRTHPNTFDPDEITILSEALDQAWTLIKDGGDFEGDELALRNEIAKHIVQSAQRGVMSVRPLRDDAVAHFGRMSG
jgi:hypothetical protein